MTCIVGLEHEGKVYLAGDIQGTGGNHKVTHTEPKVFIKGEVGFGYTTSYRFGQILQHVLNTPVAPAKEDVYKWLVSTLVPDIRKALKDSGYETGGTCLIAVKGQLWELQDDFSVLRSTEGFTAIGSGHEFAKGCMFSELTQKNGKTGLDPSKVVRRGVYAAGLFCPTVGQESTTIIIN